MLKIAVHRADKRGNVFRLLEPLPVERNLVVPSGFESDGASVPRFFWRAVFPPGDPRALEAAIAHDYIYRHHPAGWTRAEADALFLELMLAGGVPEFRALLAFAGVRLFGFLAWRGRK